MGNSPLAWAAKNGHEEVVKILLDREDIDPNKPNEESQTPLFLAACNGHERVVRLLLGRDYVDPNKSRMRRAKHHYFWPLAMGTREWWDYYLDGTMLTPTNPIGAMKRHSRKLSGMNMREW